MAEQALETNDPAATGTATAHDGVTGVGRPGPPAVPHDLPPEESHFTGRRREVDELLAEIDRPGLDVLGGRARQGCRVLLVAGRPGSGRTALAVHLAHRLAERYPDGRLFARLTRPDGTPVPTERIARHLLERLGRGAAPDPERDLAAQVREALRGRRALIVLDDVIGPEQLRPLLPDAPESLVVATSPGPLTGVPDVRPCALGGLDVPSAIELLIREAGPTRITCDPRAAESLVAECAGNPTALRLIAAWLAGHPRMSVVDALQRLRDVPEDPFPTPRGADVAGSDVPGPDGRGAADAPGAKARGRTVPAPQTAAPGVGSHPHAQGRPARAGGTPPAPRSGPPERRPAPGARAADRPAVPRGRFADADAAEPGPLPAAVPSSPPARAFWLVHDSLPAGAARMLRLLVLAPEGVADAHTASALAGCSVTAARSALDGLVRAGVLTPGPDDHRVPACLVPLLRALLEAVDRPAEVELARARMLERTVRLLHACRLALAPPDAAVRERIEALPRSLRFRSREAAADWLDARLPSLLAAARTAAADGGFDTLAQRLVGGLVRVLTLVDGDRSAELYQLHGLVLEVATRRGLHRERAAALINLADLDIRAGRPREALERYRAAVTAARADGDGAAAGRALEAVGSTYRALGDPHRAADWYGRALALRQSRGEPAEQARLHGHLGAMHAWTGQWAAGLREWRACAAVHRRLGDPRAHARALGEVAGILECAGEPEEGLRTCRDALHGARACGDTRLEAVLHLRMADILEGLGDRAGARLHRAEAERLRSTGS